MTNAGALVNAIKSWCGNTAATNRWSKWAKLLGVLLGLVSGAALAGLIAFGCASTPVAAFLKINTPSSNVSVGSSIPLQVTATDASGHTVSYTDTVHFTSSDKNAVLPTNYTFTSMDNATHLFNSGTVLNTPGIQTITVTDTTSSKLTATATFTVADVVTQLKVTAPTNSTTGSAFSVTVSATDSSGQVVTTYTGTIHFTSLDTRAVLPVNYTFVAADNGTHTFTNGFTLNTTGSQTIIATDTTTSTITGTATVGVTGVAAQLKVFVPASSTVGSAFNATISAIDSNGQAVTGYTGTVHFTSSDANATLPANYTFVAADNGTHTFTNGITLKTVGSQTVTATDTTSATITGAATIAVSSGTPTQLKLTAPSSSTVGVAFSVTVSAENSGGQVVGSYTGTVHFTSSDTKAALPANYTFAAADNGTHTFTNGFTLSTTGTQSITATDTVTATITGNTSLTVQPPVLSSIAVTPTTASVSVSQTQQYIATGTFSDGSTQTLTTGVNWNSTDTNVATIDATGLATGKTAGNTQISASVSSPSVTSPAVTLQVTPATPGLVPRYLFEVNSDKTLSTYAVLPSTGQVRAVTHFDNTLSALPFSSAAFNPLVSAIYLIQPNNASGGNATVITYAVSAGGQITVANTDNNGDLDGNPGTIAVDPLGRYLYGTDRADGQISLYHLNTNSGAASFTGTAVKVSTSGSQLAIDSAGTFVYMGDNTGSIFSYQVGANGTLTAVGTPPAQHPLMGGPIAVDPQNRYLVAVDNMSQPLLFAYVINNGTLTLVPGSPFTLSSPGGFVTEIAIDPTGTYLYGIDVANNQLLGIFNNNGVFTTIPGSPFTGAGIQPKQLSVDPSGNYVYVAYENTQEVWTYSIASSNASVPGALTQTSKMRLRSPFSYAQFVSGGLNPVTFTPQSLYVANSGTNTIGEFSIMPSSGALTSLGTPIATGTSPYDVVADPNPSNPYVYTANQGSNNISGYTIGAGGALTAMSGSLFTVGNSPEWLVVDSTGSVLLNVNSGDATMEYSTMNSAGQLFSSTFGGSTGQNPVHVSIDPNDLFAFTVNSPAAPSNGSVDYFGISLGHSTAGTTVAAGNLPRAGVVHPSGQYFYVANNGDNTIFEYTLNASTGAPTQFGSVQVPVTGVADLSSIAIEPTGNYLYVSDQKANLVYIYSINQATGTLTAASTPSIATGSAPYAITIDISGTYLYVSNLNSGDMNIFKINLANGSLSSVGTNTVPTGGTLPRGMSTTGKLQ